jgi:glutathione peroxidase
MKHWTILMLLLGMIALGGNRATADEPDPSDAGATTEQATDEADATNDTDAQADNADEDAGDDAEPEDEATDDADEPLVPTVKFRSQPAPKLDAPADEDDADDAATEDEDADVPAVLDFTMTTIDGEDRDLSDYYGKVLLFVNTASYCGYTGQYAGLQQLHDDYAEDGLAVLGFPANNFGGQEPGTDEQIEAFCTTNYNVTFDMFSKISVAGDDRHELYDVLTAFDNSTVGWNFEKFLVARDGTIIGHYRSNVTPAQLVEAIKTELDKDPPETDDDEDQDADE